MDNYLFRVSVLVSAGMSWAFFMTGFPLPGVAAAVWAGVLLALKHRRPTGRSSAR